MPRKIIFIVFYSLYMSIMAQGTNLQASADTVIFSPSSFEQFKLEAAFENKPYFILFSAPWCKPCHRIKKEIFTLPKIAKIANDNFLAYYVDIDNFDGMEINNEFKINQLPTILFFDPKGKQIDKATGYFDAYYFFLKLNSKIPPYKRTVEWDHHYIDD